MRNVPGEAQVASGMRNVPLARSFDAACPTSTACSTRASWPRSAWAPNRKGRRVKGSDLPAFLESRREGGPQPQGSLKFCGLAVEDRPLRDRRAMDPGGRLHLTHEPVVGMFRGHGIGQERARPCRYARSSCPIPSSRRAQPWPSNPTSSTFPMRSPSCPLLPGERLQPHVVGRHRPDNGRSRQEREASTRRCHHRLHRGQDRRRPWPTRVAQTPRTAFLLARNRYWARAEPTPDVDDSEVIQGVIQDGELVIAVRSWLWQNERRTSDDQAYSISQTRLTVNADIRPSSFLHGQRLIPSGE